VGGGGAGVGVGIAGGEEELRGGAVVVVGAHGEHFGSVEQCQYCCARPISGTRILLARACGVFLWGQDVFSSPLFPVCDTIGSFNLRTTLASTQMLLLRDYMAGNLCRLSSTHRKVENLEQPKRTAEKCPET
jgi:hypothetical protein